MDYVFERLDESRYKDLQFLYKYAFSEITTIDFLRKKYNTSFTGIKNIGFIAYHSITKEPAAYYGVFPLMVQYNKQNYLAAQSGDTMTHPNHRGKGLFIELAKKTYELAKNSGVEFVFGFPNQNSYPGFVNKLNWKHYSNVNHYKIIASSIPLDKVVKKFPTLGFINNIVWPKPKAIESNKQLANSLISQSNEYGCVIHNDDYYKYKTYYPSYVIEIEGIKCWVKVDGRLWVGDIQFCEEDKFNKVIRTLISFAKSKFCSSVQFSFFENSLYDNWIKKNHKIQSSIAVGCLDLSGKVDPINFAYQAADFDTF